MGYIKQEYEKDRKKLAGNWEMAMGLQKVDNLEPSDYLIEVARQNIEGVLSYEQVHSLLYKHYQDETGVNKERQKECDLVSARIADYLSDYSFSLNPETLKAMHKYLFQDVYDFAGKYRTYNLTKSEPVLGGQSVIYADFRSLQETLSYDFQEERDFRYVNCDQGSMIKRFAYFISCIWQAHPFMEGNTRTTALFTECYLNSLGFSVNNDLFAAHAQYFRNALVRANYADLQKGIYTDSSYLEAFFENLIFEGNHKLQNRNLIIADLVQDAEPER